MYQKNYVHIAVNQNQIIGHYNLIKMMIYYYKDHHHQNNLLLEQQEKVEEVH